MIDRKIFRTQAKKEYKKFIKQNPAYKSVTFGQYVSLLKLTHQKLVSGLGNSQVPTNADTSQISDMFTDATPLETQLDPENEVQAAEPTSL